MVGRCSAGDLLPIGEPQIDPDAVLRRRLAIDPPEYENRIADSGVVRSARVAIHRSGSATFSSNLYRHLESSDRTGIRLSGPAIEQTDGADLISEGIAYGAIQVPGDGQPIVLLAARQTVGGYVKIATVIGADLDRLGQVRSGDEIRFVAVTVDEARQATAMALRKMDESAIVERDKVEPMSDAGSARSERVGRQTG